MTLICGKHGDVIKLDCGFCYEDLEAKLKETEVELKQYREICTCGLDEVFDGLKGEG